MNRACEYWILTGVLLTATAAFADEAADTPAKAQESNEHPSSQKIGKNPTELAPITIKSGIVSEYVVPDASTGTKTDTPLMETPMSVQVIPHPTALSVDRKNTVPAH